MTLEEAKALYRAAMIAYHSPLTGHGASQPHIHGNEGVRGHWARTHEHALRAPEKAKAAIQAAGLDFAMIWQMHHGVDPATIPGLLERLHS